MSSSSWIFGEFILTLTQSLANINTFLRWDNNNRSFQWQVYDPPVSVYKGYSLLKDTEECLSTVGLKKPLYVFRALDLKEDMFGALTPCLFQVR